MISDTLLARVIKYFKNSNILYVEDDALNIEIVKDLLNDLFGNVTIARNGAEGLEFYKEFEYNTQNYFDLIITDIHMPILNGIDMIKAIYDINKSQKIIVLSAYDKKEYLIPLINMEVNGFIQKPISLKAILDVLSSIYKLYIDKEIHHLTDGYIYKCNTLLKDNVPINLTKNETKLLEALLKNKDEYLSLEDIYNHIFYDEPLKDFSPDSIRGFIKRLKTKLPNNLIVNNRTLGYKLNVTN